MSIVLLPIYTPSWTKYGLCLVFYGCRPVWSVQGVMVSPRLGQVTLVIQTLLLCVLYWTSPIDQPPKGQNAKSVCVFCSNINFFLSVKSMESELVKPTSKLNINTI